MYSMYKTDFYQKKKFLTLLTNELAPLIKVSIHSNDCKNSAEKYFDRFFKKFDKNQEKATLTCFSGFKMLFFAVVVVV